MFRDVLQQYRMSGDLGEIVHVGLQDYCGTYAVPIPHHFRAAGPKAARYPAWTTMPDGLPEAYRPDYEYGLNVACHDVNLLRWLFGELTARSLRVRSKGVQLARLEASGFDVTLELGRVDVGRWKQTIDVYFRKGRLGLILPSPLARQETARVIVERSGRCEELSPSPDKRVWAFKAQLAQFLAVAQGREPPVAGGADALRDLELIESLWRLVDWSE